MGNQKDFGAKVVGERMRERLGTNIKDKVNGPLT